MIRSLDSSENLDFDGALYVRVRSFLDSYGTQYDFARFWVQYDGEKQTSLLFLMDECLTVICKKGVDEGDEVATTIAPSGTEAQGEQMPNMNGMMGGGMMGGGMPGGGGMLGGGMPGGGGGGMPGGGPR